MTNHISINVRDFIVKNYTPYDGDGSFLAGPTQRTKKLWEELSVLLEKERNSPGRVLDADTKVISTITAHDAGYIDRELEQIVGLQTEKPLKRAIMPYGGLRTVEQSLEEHGYHLDPEVKKIFQYRKTHNESVFDVYTPEIRAARSNKLLTGLPDAYGRGRIIGDYRRVALYGVDYLIQQKEYSKVLYDADEMSEDLLRKREEISDQIRALKELKEMAAKYGFDISRPAQDVKEAIQWLYFGYLAAVKEQNGAAMSLGRTSTFLDIYAERDLASGKYTEEEIQEMVDHFIMKLRIVRFLRILEYDDLYAGDPVWVTESMAGMCMDGRHMVTKMTFRYLQTLINLGPAPEPNLTVLWSEQLPEHFKHFAAGISIKTSAIQYENDDLMRPELGDDYGIACCVSPMRIGKQMQFFGARANLAKCLLYAINGGVDEKSGKQVAPRFAPITGEYLDFDEVMGRFEQMVGWLAKVYIKALYCIHYMHDKYDYERIEMALMDDKIKRTTACGIAGLSVVADSLAAIKYAKVKPVRNENGIAVDFEIEGEFPKYGNNDDRVDDLAGDGHHHVHEQAAPAPHLPAQSAHPVHPDHHLQCGVRKEHRHDPGRPSGGRTPRPGRQPHARSGYQRCAGLSAVGGQGALPGCGGWHFLHLLHVSFRTGQERSGAGNQPDYAAGRLYEQNRPAPECQCSGPGNSAGCDGSS